MFVFLLACSTASEAGPASPDKSELPAPVPPVAAGQAEAVFAGGCFWCLESDFDELPGIVHTTSGYAGGKLANPTYRDVVSETTGHAEVVRVVYDTNKLSYQQVTDYFFRHIDPTDGGGQFCDRGDSYRPAIFYADDAQKQAAESAITALNASGWLASKLETTVEPLGTFWPAEAYHQDFHQTNPGRYVPYRYGCGRDRKVKEVWAKAPPLLAPAVR